ncbi:MAG: hypothetical protein ACLFP8_02510 [Alphaproteobacteria bacterium]
MTDMEDKSFAQDRQDHDLFVQKGLPPQAQEPAQAGSVSPDEDRKNGNLTKTKESNEQVRSQKVKPGIADALAGEAKDFNANLTPYLPSELIGGSIPHVPGTEDEAVWNAAAQACGTERVHYVYTVEDGRIWYLATPSSTMASNPDSWCPLAAALPGNSEHWDKETVYLYEQEGMASALRWDQETGRMQVFLGATRTILPRMQSMDANFVTINPNKANIVRWHNRMLHTEKLSRAMVRMLILLGLGVNAIAATILLISVISIAFVHSDLRTIKQETDEAAYKLIENAAEVMQSDTIRHMVRIQNLLDSLAQANGYLVSYEVRGGKNIEWNALVPTGLADQARTETTYTEIVGASIRRHVPKVEREDENNVRLIGKR